MGEMRIVQETSRSSNWAVIPIRLICNCSEETCVPSTKDTASLDDGVPCYCVYDGSVVSEQPYFPCASTGDWQRKRCSQCTSLGYCAFPTLTIDQNFWWTDCLCNEQKDLCIAVSQLPAKIVKNSDSTATRRFRRSILGKRQKRKPQVQSSKISALLCRYSKMH